MFRVDNAMRTFTSDEEHNFNPQKRAGGLKR